MLTASQHFLDNIYPTDSAREIRARAFVELFDPGQYENISSLTFSENTLVGSTEQLMNVVIESDRKYASFEPGIFKMDGSFYLVPDTAIPDTVERGWISESMSSSTGAINITATLVFIAENKLKGISLHFDNKFGYTCSDMTVSFYNLSNVLLKTVNITGNTLHAVTATANLDTVGKVVINFTKLSKAYRRLRLVEFSPGMLLIYTDKDIVGLTTLTELDPFNNNLSTPEATLSVRNEDRAIDILNTDGFEPYLQQKQKVRLFLGLVTDRVVEEYIHIGSYFLVDWKAAPLSLTATFTARGWLDRISNTDYTKGRYTGSDVSLYDVAVAVLEDAGATGYVIDASLNTIMTAGIIPVASHKELIRLIAQASNCMYYVSPSDVHYIKPIEFVVDGHLGQDQMPSPEINLDTAYNKLVVPVSYVHQDTETNKLAVFRDVLDGPQTINISHDFTGKVITKPTITGGTITAWETYDNSTSVTVTPGGAGSTEITVMGYRINVSTSDYVIEDAGAIAVSGIVEKKIDNPFINNNVMATNVAAYQMSLYQQRYLYNVTFRQNPLYETGDIVTMQDDFNKNYPVILTRNNINYAGYLSGTIDGRAVYNNVSG